MMVAEAISRSIHAIWTSQAVCEINHKRQIPPSPIKNQTFWKFPSILAMQFGYPQVSRPDSLPAFIFLSHLFATFCKSSAGCALTIGYAPQIAAMTSPARFHKPNETKLLQIFGNQVVAFSIPTPPCNASHWAILTHACLLLGVSSVVVCFCCSLLIKGNFQIFSFLCGTKLKFLIKCTRKFAGSSAAIWPTYLTKLHTYTYTSMQQQRKQNISLQQLWQ